MYKAEDLVCDVLNETPTAFAVFERHGMCQDCKDNPPPVPIRHFAEKHCQGRIDEFLAELNQA